MELCSILCSTEGYVTIYTSATLEEKLVWKRPSLEMGLISLRDSSVQNPKSRVPSPHDRSPQRGYTTPESRGNRPVSSVQTREFRVRDPEMKSVSILKLTPRDRSVKVRILLNLFKLS